jgi:hypothetical protein
VIAARKAGSVLTEEKQKALILVIQSMCPK